MSVKGLKQVQSNLKKKQKQLSKASTAGLILIGEQGTAVVKKNTPVDSGRMRNSMTWTVDGKQGNAIGDVIPVNKRKNVVIIGTNVVYGPRVEYFAKNGSAGFMLRSLNIIKRIILPNMSKSLKKVTK